MNILAATSIRNEGPFLIEWLAWMRLIGVTDFVIAANDCSDGSDDLLAALDAAGIVTYLPHRPDPGKSVQWQALKLAWQTPQRKAADWMIIADVDEFPMIHAGAHRLADLFAALPEETEAVAMPWRLFGTGGVIDYRDAPITAQLTRCAPPDLFHPIAATFFKSLFQPRAMRRYGIHRPQQKREAPPPVWVDGAGRRMGADFASHDKRMSLMGTGPGGGAGRDLVELHHYSLRSAASFLVKTARGLPNRTQKQIDLAYWVERNYNDQDNPAALALQEDLRAAMADLMARPGVAEAHARCVAAHHAEFDRLMGDLHHFSLFNQCLHAGNSTPLPPALARSLLGRFHRIRQAATASP